MHSALCALVIATQSTGLSISGRTIDAAGAGVPAHVVVGCQAVVPFTPFEAIAVTTADAEGRFTFELPREWIERGAVYRRLHLFAWLEGHGVVTQHWELTEVPAGFEPELRLPPDARERVRIVDPDGAPIAGARIWPLSIRKPEGGTIRMPSSWWREHATFTDADGWGTLPVGLDELHDFGFEAEGFGRQEFAMGWQSKGSLPSELAAMRPVQHTLRVDALGLAGAELTISTYDLRELEGGINYTVRYLLRERIGEDAILHLLAPPGPLPASVSTEDAASLVLRTSTSEEAGEGNSVNTTVLARGDPWRVHGRVVNAEDESPLAGVRLHVRTLHRGWVTSGEDGRFEFECDAGSFSIDMLQAPAGFASVQFLHEYNGRKPEEGGELDLGDVPVQPTWTATGVVRGADGEPVRGAWVLGEQTVSRGSSTAHVSLTDATGVDGRYVLPGAHAGVPLEISVRAGEHGAKGRQAPVESLELVLARTLAARGIARLPSGLPAPAVELEVWRASPPKMRAGEDLVALGGQPSFRTEQDGSFESGRGLEAELRYCLVWSGDSVEDARSEWFSGEELGRGVELKMQPLGRLRGVLRGTDGAPLVGVELRLRSGTQTFTTDSKGVFELAGLRAGGDVLIARAPEGGPRTRWVSALDVEVDWRLRLQGAERPLLPVPAHDRGLELELAMELLEERYEQAVESEDESRILRAVRNLAWADPALVLERIEAGLFETDWMRSFSLAYVADALLFASPEESLAVSMRLDRGMSRALSVLDAAERLDSAAELEQLSLVRAEARAVDPPEHRVIVYAHLADRLLDLGRLEAARGVLAEGRAVAELLPPEGWAGYARSRFGEVLARVDFDGGCALIDELADANERPRHFFNTAHQLAASDPEASETLVTQFSAEPSTWSIKRYVSRIVHRMASVDLVRARRIAALHDRTGFSDGMIALALAPDAPEEARASLVQAFQRAEALAESSPEWDERPVTSAAALLPVVERVDPEALREYVSRALALRRPPARATFGGDDVIWREDATLAFYLARWEPALARKLLEPAVAAARKLRGNELNREYDAVWAAAAVIDPAWAAGLGTELGGRAASRVGLVLAVPPGLRTTYVQDELLGLWIVGKEDL